MAKKKRIQKLTAALQDGKRKDLLWKHLLEEKEYFDFIACYKPAHILQASEFKF